MPSPKYCPICGERTWSSQDTGSESDARRSQSHHIRAKHAEYERWNRRLERGSSLMLIAALFVLATFLLTASMDTARLFTIPLSAVLILTISSILVIPRRTGPNRFRDLRKQEHGALQNPGRNHTVPGAARSRKFLVH